MPLNSIVSFVFIFKSRIHNVYPTPASFLITIQPENVLCVIHEQMCIQISIHKKKKIFKMKKKKMKTKVIQLNFAPKTKLMKKYY